MATMEGVAESLGIGTPVLWFLIAFAASIPASWLWRFMPSVQARHLYAAASGAVLSHAAFGASSNAYFMLPILASYGSMLFYRRKCGVISAVIAFAYLIGCHVAFMSGDAWKKGGMDSTGSMMVLTLKVSSAAFNYQDGLLTDEKSLRDAQKKYRLTTLPSFLAYLGYCFNCGSHLVGPVTELRDYMDWTENRGLWDPKSPRPPPSPYTPAFLATIKAFICMGLYMCITGAYPLSFATTPEFLEWGYWHRVWYQYMCGFGARWKYYFIWSLSEAAVIISGFGFSGWTTVAPSEQPKALWSRAQNVEILNVELATSAAEIPKYWNIHVSVWLRHYVYERLVVKGKRPGFRQLLATQVVSAVWHGLYTGYLLFFINSALMIAGARVLYKWQQAIPKSNFLAVNLGAFAGFFYTAFVLNLTAMGFLVLYYADTITIYRSVYYSGTLLPVAFILLGKFVKPPRAGQSSAKAVKKEA
jgi:lysophospholipid acyltransferase